MIAFLVLSIAVTTSQQLQVAYAEHVPIRHYGISDGLPHSRVTSIYQDAKGYLWFGTWEGLSRFDGYRFVTYGIHDGLANSLINAIAEDRKGHLWVATQGAVSRLIDDPQEAANHQIAPGSKANSRQKFASYKIAELPGSNVVGRLAFDSSNVLWCATDIGLYRGLSGSDNSRFELVLPSKSIDSVFCDSQGRLWFSDGAALNQVVDSQLIKYAPPDNARQERINRIVEDRHGRLLIAYAHDLFEFTPPANGASQPEWKRLPLRLAPGDEIWSLAFDSSESFWIGTNHGLIKYKNGQLRTITTAQGLSDNAIVDLYEDREDNLWIGTSIGGLCKSSGETIVTFTTADGLPDQETARIIEDSNGHIYVDTGQRGLVEIVGDKAVPVPGFQNPPLAGANKRIIRDRRGNWWFGTDQGLFYCAAPDLRFDRIRKLTAADGIPEVPIFLGPGIYEDTDGKIWVSTADDIYWSDSPGQTRPHFHAVHLESISSMNGRPLDFIRDRSSALWLATYEGTWRWSNGKLSPVNAREGLPESNARSFFQDSRGWLWLGLRFKGVSLIKDPTTDPLRFTNYSTREGLLSDAVWSITEDDSGRIYLGTGRGLDQLEFSTGNIRIRHFTRADGLAGDTIWHCMKDSLGNIWLATSGGVSRFNPHAEHPFSTQLPVYLSRIQAAGEELLMPETGSLHVPAVVFSPSQK